MSTQPEQMEEPCPLGPGEVLSQRYSLELFIGEGSFGWVFSALDLTQGLRRVAIKVLRRRYAEREDMLRRFEERELALLLRVQDTQPTPHVVRALAPTVLRHEDLSYLVLEFIDGPSLREVLDGGAALAPERIRRLGLGLARGLAAIHAAEGVHRDLKPANVRLRGEEEPVIVDFGTALTLWTAQSLTVTGQAPMTPRYASPEQLAGRESTCASDIYAWGVMLYELLTGTVPPETGERALPGAVGEGAWREEHRRLLEPVLRCLEYAPERRPTARELISALSTSPVPAAPTAPIDPPGQRTGLRWALGVLALVLLVLGVRHAAWTPPPSSPGVPPSPSVPRPSSWSHRFGDAASQQAVRLVRDAHGDLFLAGGFEGSVDLGAGPLTSAGSEDLLVARFAPDGGVRWSRRFGDGGFQGAKGLAVGPTGELWLFGDFEGTLDLGDRRHVSPNGSKLFLARFDAEGRPVWSQDWGEGALMDAAALAIAPDGSLTLLGNFMGSVDFGCGALVSPGSLDVFLARLSPRGQCLWSRRFGDERYQGGLALAVDAAGRSAVWGYFEGTLELGGGALVNSGTGSRWEGYLAVFDAEGRHAWSRQLPLSHVDQTEYEYPTWALQFAPNGELLFLGEGDLPSASASSGIHVARFSANGQLLWSRRLGDSRSIASGQLALTEDGRLLLAGSVRGTVDLGDGPFAGSGGPGSDLFVLELGGGGEFLSARRFAGTAASSVQSLVAGEGGAPLLSGVFEGSLALEDRLLSTAGGGDLFLAQLTPSARPPPPAPETGCRSPPSGASAWYPLDASGPVSEGRLFAGARWVAGRGHGVLGLEDGYFEAPPHEALDVGGGDFSLSLWVRTNDLREARVLLDKRAQRPSPLGPLTGYALFLDRGRLVFQLANGQGAGGCGLTGSCTDYVSPHFVADGAWHLVTVTVERRGPEGGTVFVDGTAVGRFSPGLRPGSLDNPGPLRLGSRSFEVWGLLRGLLDDVAVWKRALSADEVARLYRAGGAGPCEEGGAHSSASPRKP